MLYECIQIQYIKLKITKLLIKTSKKKDRSKCRKIN